eukprot:TRINITY_DN2363_c0_g2_i1.p1 TRINITY_DN2363_c0_g2~~TRINITY_DN2363_c0_g2_i1.p1  ORF type:complete len:258 (+),score=76.60 TRINITY_DN2363_c0_g2_i1:167-940(+)
MSERASKPEQVLIIHPSTELEFVGPFSNPVTQVMTLTNPTSLSVCFKIKTTAPKKYCVKPNSGLIEPKQTVQINVGLQPFHYDSSEKNKHKFMVQSVYAPNEEFSLEDLWKEGSGHALMDSKLKCLFTLPSERDSAAPNDKQAEKIVPADKSLSSTSVSAAKPTEVELKKSVDEIKRLQEEISSLRRENIVVKEEVMRRKRLASNAENESSSSPSSPSSSSYVVRTESPETHSLTTTYVYLALIMFLMGFVIGRWII